MSKMIKMVVDDKTHAKLIKKADELGMKRERFYQQIMKKAAEKK